MQKTVGETGETRIGFPERPDTDQKQNREGQGERTTDGQQGVRIPVVAVGAIPFGRAFEPAPDTPSAC